MRHRIFTTHRILWRILKYAPQNHQISVAHIDICATECWSPMCCVGPTRILWRIVQYAPQKASILWRIFFLCATEFQKFYGAYYFMRHRNIFVEHAFIYAPQNLFLSISVFLVVCTIHIFFEEQQAIFYKEYVVYRRGRRCHSNSLERR